MSCLPAAFGARWIVHSRTSYLLDAAVFPFCGISGRRLLFSEIYLSLYFVANFLPAVEAAQRRDYLPFKLVIYQTHNFYGVISLSWMDEGHF